MRLVLYDNIKQHLSQFRSYYMWQTIGIICVLVFGILFIRDMLNKQDIALSLVFLNANYDDNTYEQLQTEYLNMLGLDSEDYTVDLELASQTPGVMLDEYDLAASEKIASAVSSKVLDLLIADAANFDHYAKSGACEELNMVLDMGELEQYKDKIYYIDLAELDSDREVTDAEEMFQTSDVDAEQAKMQEKKANFSLPDPADMKEPCAVGIVLSDSRFIKKYGLYSDTVCILGFARNSTRVEQAVKTFKFMIE